MQIQFQPEPLRQLCHKSRILIRLGGANPMVQMRDCEHQPDPGCDLG